MIRTFFVFAFLGLCIFLALPWLLLWTLLTRNPGPMYRLSMKANAFAMRIAGVRVHVDGLENIPAGVCVFASNHASNLDPLVLLPAIPRRVSILLKKELLRIPILGAAMRAADFVYVERANREAAAASIGEVVGHLRKGLSFVVFAEGTRSPDGRLRPFKKGAILMAIKAGVPVVPVAISGAYTLMRKGHRRIYPGDVTVRFGPAVDPSQFPSHGNELLIRLESAVAAALPASQRPAL